MGAWGHEIFDNDAACDWEEKLLAGDDLRPVEEAFRDVLESGSGVDADDASQALAACETLAHMLGRPGLQEASLDALAEWVRNHKSLPYQILVPNALKVLERIESEDCHLWELWKEADELDKWLATVRDVRQRLEKSC